MKRFGLWVCAVFLFATAGAVQAEGEEGGAKEKGPHHMMAGKMGGPGMKAMMMGKMMERDIVATSDGGVVVLVGNKLLKYDKNLDLKAEAEVKVDKECLKKMMRDCPMAPKKGAGVEGAAVDSDDAPAEAEVPAEGA